MLNGAKILITRPSHQVEEFARLIRENGGIPISFPTIEIKPLDFEEELESELKKPYRWIVFTSVNGVRFAFGVVRRQYPPQILETPFPSRYREGKGVKDTERRGNSQNRPLICAIGPATARAIKESGGHVDFVPEKFISSEIANSLPIEKGDKVLLLRAKIAPPDLRNELARRGAIVREIAIYDTVEKEYSSKEVRKLLERTPDFITFTSSSTFKAFINILEKAKMEPFEIFRESKIAVIGPVTAKTVESFGFRPDIVADEHTLLGLLKAISKEFKEVRL